MEERGIGVLGWELWAIWEVGVVGVGVVVRGEAVLVAGSVMVVEGFVIEGFAGVGGGEEAGGGSGEKRIVRSMGLLVRSGGWRLEKTYLF